MASGIFSSLSGGLAKQQHLDIIANNLANVNTNGYKEDKVSFRVLDAEPHKRATPPIPPDNYKIDPSLFPLVGNDIKHSTIGAVTTDFSPGALKKTDNVLDIALGAKGFLKLETEAGAAYTRQSTYTMGQNGVLVTPQGHPLQGEKGAIFLTSANFNINEQGDVFQDGKLIDRLVVVDFIDPQKLQKIGASNFIHNGAPDNLVPAKEREIHQGFVETSNVNTMRNLTEMIVAQRSYEAYQKAIKAHDDIMGKANTLGDIRA